MIPVLVWWLIFQIIGWLALPLTMHLFRWLPDQGYTSSKAVGLLVTSYILWLGASTGFLRNDLGGIFFSLLILGGLSAWQLRPNLAKTARADAPPNLNDRLSAVIGFLKTNRHLVLTSEILFAAAFILWAVLRAYAADKIMNAGGEKFMEIAFLNAILNSKTFPPLDPWLSGFAIAYYYFGYVMMGWVTRLSGVPAGIGFDLYDAVLFALTALGAFGIVFNLVGASKNNPGQTGAPSASSPGIRFGLLGAFLVTVLGNLTGLLEALRARGALPQAFFEWIAIPGLEKAPVTGSWFPGSSGGWWWWRGSRVIQDFDLAGNALDVSPITEFPFFSFLLGDNHPHVLGLPFVLLAITLAFNLLRSQAAQNPTPPAGDAPETFRWWHPIAYCLQGDTYLFGFAALLLGGLAFLNTWDFPIYLGLVLLAYAGGQALSARGLQRLALVRTVVLAGWLTLGSIGLYIFFYASFDSQAGGILPYIFPPTRLVQYGVMFGIFLFILIGFLLFYLAHLAQQGYPAWHMALRCWGWSALAGASLYGLIALILSLGEILARWAPQLHNSELQSRLGGMSFGQAAWAVVVDRVQNPLLFLVLSALVGLGWAAARLSLNSSQREDDSTEGTDSRSTSLMFVLLLLILGFILTWSVEFFYLRDSFVVRMNTVFKFYYQAWVMLACASAFAMWWLGYTSPGWLATTRRVWLAFAVGLIFAGFVYPVQAFYSRTAGFRGVPNLDGASGIAQNNPDDWAAIQWLQQEANRLQDLPVILEAPGKSYTYEGRISAFTGLPSVLGWAIHESQWRGNYEEQGKREPDIAAIYSSHDGSFALELLHKWNVDYVILGWSEQNYIQQLCSDQARRCNLTSAMRKFGLVLNPVFSQGLVTIYAVPGK
jgi:YYY domain-containing protein